MWTFCQSTGVLEHNGKRVARGYSGARDLRMISSFDSGSVYSQLRNFGHIPPGTYGIGRSFSTKSRTDVLSLTPAGHDAFKRTAFLIHGDYLPSDPRRGTASEGCVILDLVSCPL